MVPFDVLSCLCLKSVFSVDVVVELGAGGEGRRLAFTPLPGRPLTWGRFLKAGLHDGQKQELRGVLLAPLLGVYFKASQHS